MALHFVILPVTQFMQNATLLWDDNSKEAVLTDVGGDVDYLLGVVAQKNLRLMEIWLTHGHVDHVAGVPDLRQICDVPILGPQSDDAFWIDQLSTITQAYGFPHAAAFAPTRWLNEGDTVSVGAYSFTVLHIPGHTPGSLVYYSAEAKLLIAGDVLFRESIGRTDFPKGNHQDLIDNIRQKIFSLPDDTRVITGHGAMTTIAHEKTHNPFVQP